VKKFLASALTFAALGGWGASSARPKTDLKHLARLYEDGSYFELRDALALLRDDPSPELEFFRGVSDQVFNRLDIAVTRLRRFLAVAEREPARPLAREAWILLADAHRRRGLYRDAAEACRKILDKFGPLFDDQERANYGNQAELWSSLAGVPPPGVEIREDAAIRMAGRRLPVRVGTIDFYAGYDTGSNMSVLYESLAAELGVPRYGPDVRIQTSTGFWVRGWTGVLPEMRLGPIVVRNVLVLVLPDRFFPPANSRPGPAERGLIGAPVLEALGEFTETAAGEFLVPARPGRRSEENMCFSGYMPVVEAVHRGKRIRLCLDTGAAATVLYLPFYKRHRGEINARSRERPTTVDGVGTSRRISVRLLDEFDFRAGGKDLALKKVIVQTEGTHADTRYFHGVLGIDLLALCSRMTLNFRSMSFILE
jgi:hypothetical protein